MLSAAAVAAAGMARPAEAADQYWLGTFSGFWTNNFNWEFASPPGPGDIANFEDDIGFGVVRSAVILDANRTVLGFVVHGNHPFTGAYSFTSNNNAVLTVTGETNFGLATSGTSTTTLNGFRLNTGRLFVRGPTTLVMTGGANVTTTADLNVNNSSVINLNSGSLNLAANDVHDVRDTATLNVNGGTLNLGANSTLNILGGGKLNFSGGYNVINNTLLRAEGGADIVGASFIDVGNGGLGFLTVNQAGSTITAQSSTSDWGREASGRAVVDIFTGGTASVANLRVGEINAQASVNVSGGTLNVNGTLSAGGGTTVRAVQFTIQNSGTMNVTGASTFNNQADINLVSGTLDFNNTATFNSGSRLDITGGTLDTTGQTLTINGGTLTRSTSGALSSGSLLRVQGGGTATFSSFFDIGNGNTGVLDVTGPSSTLTAGDTTDWGFGSAGSALVSIQSNGVANLNSLRIGNNNGSASVTVTSGGQLRPNVLTVGGGSNNRTVSLTINGGTVTTLSTTSSNTFNDKAVLNLQAGTFDPKGDVSFFAGSTANWSGGSFLIASGKTLAVQGGVINRTITTAGGLSPGATLAISAAGRFESTGSYTVGENGAGTVTINGANSRLVARRDLTLGGTSAGQVGTVTTTNSGAVIVGDAGDPFGDGSLIVSDSNPAAANAGGKLTIANGSVLNHSFDVVLAPSASTHATVLVTGTNSAFVVGGLFLLGNAGGGVADVRVENGGRTSVTGDYAAPDDNAGIYNTTITGTGSLLEASNLFVSTNNSATTLNQLVVSAGGRAQSSFQVVVGSLQNSAGAVFVNGTNSTIAVGTRLEVGHNGTGTLNINSAGVVSSADTVAGTGTGSGTINIDGANSSLRASNNLTLNNGSTLTTTTGGTVLVGDNASGFVSDRLVVGDNNAIGSGQGGVLTITGGSVLNHHSRVIVSPFDNTFGEIRVNGANSQLVVGELLIIGNGSTNCTALITIEAGGKVKTDTFQGSSPTSKIIINAGGTFEANSSMLNRTRDFLALGFNGGNWLGARGITSVSAQSDSRLGVGYTVSGALLTAKLTLKGDTDLSGGVDFTDLVNLARSYNLSNKFWMDGDFNYDGLVGFADLVELARNYNVSLSPTNASELSSVGGADFMNDWAMAQTMVPEPATAMLAVGIASLGLRRRRAVAPERTDRDELELEKI